MASSCFLAEKVGYTTFVSNTLPVSSTTATLQPLRYPGSRPITTVPFTGGCIKRGFRFNAKFAMAEASARSVSVLRSSRSALGAIRRS